MQTESLAAQGQWQPADITSANTLHIYRDEMRTRWLPTLRVSLACGILLCLSMSLLDTIYLPDELLPLTMAIRILSVLGAVTAALTATYIEKLQLHIDAIITTFLVVAGVGVSAVAVVAAGVGNAASLAEPILMTLGIYLMAGLSLRQSVFAAMPTFLAFMVLGVFSGLSVITLSYALLFMGIANVIGVASCINRENDGRRLAEGSRQLTGLINTDRLTGIYNRQMFDDHLARIWKQSRRECHNISLLIVDIDHMREFNKRYGHPEGDRCIQRVGVALKNSVRRPLDFVARFDGSKFAMVLYNPPTVYIRRHVVNIQTAIAGLHIPNEGSPIGPRVTVSIGAVVLGPQTTKSLEGALQFAEEALSASKLRGRDRAVVFQSSDLENAAKSASANLSASA